MKKKWSDNKVSTAKANTIYGNIKIFSVLFYRGKQFYCSFILYHNEFSIQGIGINYVFLIHLFKVTILTK